MFDTNYKLPEQTLTEVLHFKKWIEYIDLIEKKIYDNDGVFVLQTTPCNSFRAKFNKEKMLNDLELMIASNLIVKEEIIPFKDTFLKAEKNNKVETFYNLLVTTFFKKGDGYKQITIDGVRVRFYKDVKRVNLESLTVNFLYSKIPEATL